MCEINSNSVPHRNKCAETDRELAEMCREHSTSVLKLELITHTHTHTHTQRDRERER